MRNWEFVLRYNLDKLFRVEIPNESRSSAGSIQGSRVRRGREENMKNFFFLAAAPRPRRLLRVSV